MIESLPPEFKLLHKSIIKRFNRKLTEVEEKTIDMLCWSAYLHQTATKTILDTGILVKSPRGAIIHPLVKVAKDEAETFMRLSNQLQLRPTEGNESFDLWDKLAKEIMK